MNFGGMMRAPVIGMMAVLAAVTGSQAQGEAPTMRSFAKSLARMNALLIHCPSEAPGFDVAGLAPTVTKPIMTQTLQLLAGALTERALSLGVDKVAASTGVATYMSAFDRLPPNLDAYKSACTSATAQDLSRSLAVVQTDRFRQFLTTYAQGEQYRQPFVVRGTAQETFASPQTQQRLVSAMSTHFEHCADMSINNIEKTGEKVRPADGLPVFVKPAIIYEESWQLACDGVEKTFAVMHARDSEGPVGNYTVSSTPASQEDRKSVV